MLFTTTWLAQVLDVDNPTKKASKQITQVITDSRKPMNDALFIPLVGENFDGHDYLLEAVNQGAAAVLWQKDKKLPDDLPEHLYVFDVDDTLDGMQKIASAYRDKINPKVIGVTGSNGKTTTKDLLASVLQTSFKTHFTYGNLNNHIGLPLTILSMPPETDVLILEMGMNHSGEIELLSRLARPNYAVITNIGESHIANLGSRKGIAKAKLEIVSGMAENGYLTIDGDELLLQSDQPVHKLACGFGRDNDVIIQKVDMTRDKTSFKLADGSHFQIPLLGKHHVLNAVFAITVARLLKIDETQIHTGLLGLNQTAMRFELLNGIEGTSIINDAYNASPTSMKASINVVKDLKGFGEKVLVLGDVFELGDQSEYMHRSIAESIDSSITAVLTIGSEAYYIMDAVKQRLPSIDCRYFRTKESLKTAIKEYTGNETLILFKASRGMQLESLVTDFSI